MHLRMSAALVAGFVVLAARSGLADSSTMPSIRALERGYAEYLLVHRPDRGSREGVRGAAARLVPVTESSLERDLAWLSRFRARCALVDSARIAPSDRVRLGSLLMRVARQQEESAPQGPLRRDALAYRVLTDQAVLEVITTPRVGECERVRRATLRLHMLPEVLRAAAINLRAMPQDDARVQRGVDDAIRVLRAEVIAAAVACHDPRRRADLVEADSAAIRAYQVFPRWLRDAPGPAR